MNIIKNANGIIEFKNKYILVDQQEAQAIIKLLLLNLIMNLSPVLMV